MTKNNRSFPFPFFIHFLFLGLPILLIFYYYHVDFNKEAGVSGVCPSKLLMNWECMLCGGQRSFKSLLEGNIIKAFKYNELFVVSIPFLILLYIDSWRKLSDSSAKRILPNWSIYAFLFVAIVFMIYRNII